MKFIVPFLCSSSLTFANIAIFDFQNAWTGSKEPDFEIFASNSASVDTDALSVTSLLSNSGYTSGSFASFSLSDSAAGTSIFSTSSTPDVGINLGGANQTTPTHFLSFKVTPTAGAQVNYTSLSLFAGTNAANDQYDLELVAIDGSGVPTVMGTHTQTSGSSNNDPVQLVTFDFPDFTSTNITEWRLFAYNINGAGNGVRFDDITLNGTSSVTPTNFKVYFLGGQSLSLIHI